VLVILIPAAWLAVILFFVVLCQMAASGDAALATMARSSRRRPRRAALELFPELPVRRHTAYAHPLANGALMLGGRVRRLRRSRRPQCISGS
jgi:hypothetical protein